MKVSTYTYYLFKMILVEFLYRIPFIKTFDMHFEISVIFTDITNEAIFSFSCNCGQI